MTAARRDMIVLVAMVVAVMALVMACSYVWGLFFYDARYPRLYPRGVAESWCLHEVPERHRVDCMYWEVFRPTGPGAVWRGSYEVQP
jgi:hypothetical protein